MNKTVTQSENEITAPIGTHHMKHDVYLTPSALHLKNLIEQRIYHIYST